MSIAEQQAEESTDEEEEEDYSVVNEKNSCKLAVISAIWGKLDVSVSA